MRIMVITRFDPPFRYIAINDAKTVGADIDASVDAWIACNGRIDGAKLMLNIIDVCPGFPGVIGTEDASDTADDARDIESHRGRFWCRFSKAKRVCHRHARQLRKGCATIGGAEEVCVRPPLVYGSNHQSARMLHIDAIELSF